LSLVAAYSTFPAAGSIAKPHTTMGKSDIDRQLAPPFVLRIEPVVPEA
jgi:hypothetical protein